MVICPKCKKEMMCVKTGVVCVWNKSHCYSGDKFECKQCNSQTIITSKDSFFSKDILKNPDIEHIEMD